MQVNDMILWADGPFGHNRLWLVKSVCLVIFRFWFGCFTSCAKKGLRNGEVLARVCGRQSEWRYRVNWIG